MLREVLLLLVAWAVAGCGENTIRLGDGRPLPDTGAAIPFDSEPRSGPRRITAVSSADAADDDPSLTADRTLLYFNSDRADGMGEEDIWAAGRDGRSEPWGDPYPVPALNTSDRETGIALAPDGLTIWFSSDRPGGMGGLDIYTARRGRLDVEWSSVEREARLSSAQDDLVSAVDEARSAIWLARREDGDADYDVYVARRSSSRTTWDEPVPVEAFRSEAPETDAFPLAGELGVVFTRSEDLHLARHVEEPDSYAEPRALSTLNSDGDDRDAWVSTDLRYVVFASDREGELGLYEAFF